MSPITVFISYSHDSDEHRDLVLRLSERLRADGIVTILDRYVGKGSPPEGWPRWMMNGLIATTHVLCVCTETYRRRFLGQEVPGKGKGVDWEGALVTQALYDARSHTNKFIPVLFARSDESHIPEALRLQTHYVLDSEASYQALYDALLDQAGVEPGAVGELKRKPRTTAQPVNFDSSPSAPMPAASSPSQTALSIWREKLEFLLVEDAVCVDPGMKFRLKHLITEAQENIRSLGEC
jgi:SEFIR domain